MTYSSLKYTINRFHIDFQQFQNSDNNIKVYKNTKCVFMSMCVRVRVRAHVRVLRCLCVTYVRNVKL